MTIWFVLWLPPKSKAQWSSAPHTLWIEFDSEFNVNAAFCVFNENFLAIGCDLFCCLGISCRKCDVTVSYVMPIFSSRFHARSSFAWNAVNQRIKHPLYYMNIKRKDDAHHTITETNLKEERRTSTEHKKKSRTSYNEVTKRSLLRQIHSTFSSLIVLTHKSCTLLVTKYELYG